MSGNDIFISYSREDRAAARYFAECFSHEGFSVWWDAALHSGETFDEVIEKELKASKAVVVLWSPRSVQSRWVRAEATLADRRNKLAPVIIEACDRPIIFELHHTVDLADWTGDTGDARWKGFIYDIKRIIDRNSQAAAPAAEAVKPAWARSDRISGSADTPRRSHRDPMFGGATEQRPPPARSRAPEPEPEPVPGPAPQLRARQPDPDDDDDSQATQFYTKLDGVDLFGVDQFHCLEIAEVDGAGQRYVVSPVGLKIGRSEPADIVLGDPRVSRSHCLVELAGEDLKVSDLGSTNGTYVDGERVDGHAMLPVGSLLRVGNVCFKHEIRSRAEV